MRAVNVICTLVWFATLLAYCFTDYTPGPLTIGSALFITSISFLENALDQR